jgi:hypothetical protein
VIGRSSRIANGVIVCFSLKWVRSGSARDGVDAPVKGGAVAGASVSKTKGHPRLVEAVNVQKRKPLVPGIPQRNPTGPIPKFMPIRSRRSRCLFGDDLQPINARPIPMPTRKPVGKEPWTFFGWFIIVFASILRLGQCLRLLQAGGERGFHGHGC